MSDLVERLRAICEEAACEILRLRGDMQFLAPRAGPVMLKVIRLFRESPIRTRAEMVRLTKEDAKEVSNALAYLVRKGRIQRRRYGVYDATRASENV